MKTTPSIQATASFALLRSPLLPIETLLDWQADGAALDSAQARSLLRTRLDELVSRPEVDEAIYVASPSLHGSLDAWRKAPESERGQKIEHALVRYVARMCTRATPFGLFAGCSVVDAGERTEVELPPIARYQRHARLDMDYLCAVTEALARDPALRRDLVYRPSSSLYDGARKLRYVTSSIRPGHPRGYTLCQVERDDVLERTLARAHGGATPPALAAALVDEDISLEEATGYVEQLIDEQLIVPDLVPALTGDEPLSDLVEQLERSVHGRAFGAELARVGNALTALDGDPLGVDTTRYTAIHALLAGLPVTADPARFTVQVDLAKPMHDRRIGRKVFDELQRAAEVLAAIEVAPRDVMADFRVAFSERYEGRAVRLVDALDDEIGVGFARSERDEIDASPACDGIAYPAPPKSSAPQRAAAAVALLQRKLLESVRTSAHVELDDHDLAVLARPDNAPLPDSFAVFGTVEAKSARAMDDGDFCVSLNGVFGPSGANLLGRFCHANPDLTARVRAHLRAEEALRPDAIYAEIVHLPNDRHGNVILRPLLRGHEIVYLGRSGAPEAQQIPITDLWLRMEGQRIALWSSRLGREIVPRLTSAHTFSRGFGFYRFLGQLQRQGVLSAASFDWGILATSPFTPRVVSGRAILARARWRFEPDELEKLGGKTPADRLRAMHALREQRNLPRFVCTQDDDSELFYDLDNALSVDALAADVRARKELTLRERITPSAGDWLRGPEGTFCHELVVPFVRDRVPHRTTMAAPTTPALARSFTPGSEWLYVKLYGGPRGVDDMLREVVAPVLESVRERICDRWFFIRYGDPDWHLRLRLHGDPQRLLAEVLPQLRARAEDMIVDGRIRRIQLDTYEREIERYGGARGLEIAEAFFHEDSEAVLGVLLEEGAEDADVRWRATLRGVDELLTSLGFTTDHKLALVRDARDSFFEMSRGDAALKHSLGAKFRIERDALAPLLADHESLPVLLKRACRRLSERSAKLEPVWARLRQAESAGVLTKSVERLVPIYMHMHANRLLRSAGAAQELVIYDFLARLYESELKRSPR